MAKVDFGHLQRTSVELTEHATYFLPISTFTLAYSTLKNYLVLSINRGSLRKWSKMQPGEIKFQNKSGGM